MHRLFYLLIFLASIGNAQQKEIKSEIITLYTDTIPNATGHKIPEMMAGTASNPIAYKQTSVPAITGYFPAKESANGTAVIIFPGGAYEFLAFQEEGTNIAQTLVKYGITAFVVKYRLPDDAIMVDKSIGPLQDAQQAVKTVRMRAAEWGIDSNKIGVMGFSAGGHLAATLGTHFGTAYIPNTENINLRPDFMILVYPVISMADTLTHPGSREHLLGPSPSIEKIAAFSNELQVNSKVPPTWITHAGDDKLVSVNNSIFFYEALLRANVPAEMHLYPEGGHGFVLHQKTDEWMQPLLRWMKAGGW